MKKKPLESISGGMQTFGSKKERPSMSKGQAAKSAGRLAAMGFGSKKK